MDFKSNNVVYRWAYHVVFCPKHQRTALKHGVDMRLKGIVHIVDQETCSKVVKLDHVHLLLDVDPQSTGVAFYVATR